MFIAALIALSVVASVFLILSDSVPLLRVGIAIALWAAVIGAFAMTKFRREAAADNARARDLQTVYELQLEREIAARREYELSVESRVRREVGADAGEMAALRAEIAALRANLEVLFDGKLPVDRVALRADATRVQELDQGPYSSFQPAASGLFVPESSGGPRLSNPYDDPVTAETSIIPSVGDGAEKDENEPADTEDAEVETEVAEPAEAEVDGAESEVEEPESEPLPEPAAGSRRRRRREADSDDPTGSHSTGLSVAELMAKFQSESTSDTGAQSTHHHGN